jgi:hypothetical protein
MNRIISAVLTASALIFGVFLPREESAAQTTAKDLAGTWTLVSIAIEQDGKKTDIFGPDPQGQETRARLTAMFRSSSAVRIFQSSHPTITRQELQKKIRPSCRGALPTSA